MTKPAIICVNNATVLPSLKIELKQTLGDEYSIEIARSSKAALELLTKLKKDEREVALVLASYPMLGSEGDELFKQINALSPQTLVLMLIEKAVEVAGNTIRRGRNCYIATDDLEDLKATVVEAIDSYQQDKKLKAQNIKLQQTNQELEQAIANLKQEQAALQQKAQRTQALNQVIRAIRNSLNLTTIFATATSEIGKLLQVEHVTIIRGSQGTRAAELWKIIAEHRHNNNIEVKLGREFPVLDCEVAQLLQLKFLQIDDRNSVLAQMLQPGWLALPLQVNTVVWGCIGLGNTTARHSWQDWEVELAGAVAEQLAIAIGQAELHDRVQQLNVNLQQQVQERTTQLQLAYEFESTLKRITDKVRDSLDENQILQSAVEALVQVLGVGCCNAALFDLEQGTSTIYYEYTTTIPPSHGRVSRIADFPELYDRLLHGQYFQFCSLLPHPRRGRVAMLVCPIVDDRGVLGDLWLINQSDYGFNEQDIRLVQQVANQCAIALRQAKLYQAAQAQVVELERLNRLQDEFISTVSHELRSPMSNIKLAIKMLEVNLKQLAVFDARSNPINRYFQILKDECERETNLINDLLDLSLLDSGSEFLNFSTEDLPEWVLQIATPFIERTRNQQQSLQLNFPTDLPPISTDFSYLERILIELLNNACKYTPTGETIIVSARVTSERLHLSVANSGIEIVELEQKRIFDKFYRIPHHDPWKHGGTGLGLALVKKRVERLQGSIEVASEPGWTTFTMEIPVLNKNDE